MGRWRRSRRTAVASDHRGVQLPPGPCGAWGRRCTHWAPQPMWAPACCSSARCQLWANPLLRLELPLASWPVLADSGFVSLLAMPGLRTQGDLMALIRRLSAWEAPHAAAARMAARLHLPIQLPGRSRQWLWRAIPGSWRRAAAPPPGGAAGAVPAVPGEASRALLERMGWRLPRGGHTVPLVGPPFTSARPRSCSWRSARPWPSRACAPCGPPSRRHGPAGGGMMSRRRCFGASASGGCAGPGAMASA
jgi:hypothetical protein